ncbi:MAG: hypothetical protein CMC79_00540 [Flavobacteriaceae bacterium]|nr:hypothetical protein [Flavobacteriaceae bacterium]|tara:strand:- start:26040 stop:27275 length:1236 start_codon:yes stop_codon:yes gene_type:complete
MLNIQISLTDSVSNFVAFNSPKLSYSKKPLGNELFFSSCSLLFEQGIQNSLVKVFKWKKYPVFFQVSSQSIIPFDLFAASFYLITRYEEHLPHIKNVEGQFTSSESIAGKNNFLDKPIIDYWVLELRSIIKEKFPEIIISSSASKKIVPILEVSTAYKFKYKSAIFSVYQAIKSMWKLNFDNLFDQILVLFRFKNDPFLEYDFIINFFKKNNLSLVFFFRFTKYALDHSSESIFNSSFQSLIKNISDKSILGLLVSGFAQKKEKFLKKEIDGLFNLTHKNLKKVRLNNGIISISEIYPLLVQQEILEDYSMGYKDSIGYRASTSLPFYYYDLINEIKTPLKIFPIVATEESLKQKNETKGFKKILDLYSSLPLQNSVHAFTFSPKVISKSKEDINLRESFLKYISEYKKRK